MPELARSRRPPSGRATIARARWTCAWSARAAAAGSRSTLLRESIYKARQHGYRLRPSQPKLYLSRRAAHGVPAQAEPRPGAQVPLQRDPQPAVNASGEQRPGDRASPGTKQRADVARTAAQRPALRRHDPDGPGRSQDPELPLPGHLPQRPEPGPRGGPRRLASCLRLSPPLMNRQGIPDLGACVRCNLQFEGTGVVPTDVIVDGASDYESSDRRGAPAHAGQARDHPRGPRRRLRGPQPDGPRSARARHLRRGDRRLPDRHGEDVLGRRLRQPHVHLRPRPLHGLRRVRRR